MTPRWLLRAEGLAAFAAATAIYALLDGPAWLYLLLFLAPDLGMVGYLAGPRAGSRLYNALHTYALPLALAGLGAWLARPTLLLVAAIWTAHVGFDRVLGYGLKYPTGFGDTHLDAERLGAGGGPTAGTSEAGSLEEPSVARR